MQVVCFYRGNFTYWYSQNGGPRGHQEATAGSARSGAGQLRGARDREEAPRGGTARRQAPREFSLRRQRQRQGLPGGGLRPADRWSRQVRRRAPLQRSRAARDHHLRSDHGSGLRGRPEGDGRGRRGPAQPQRRTPRAVRGAAHGVPRGG